VNVLVQREEVVHDQEMDLLSARELHAVQAVEARDERVGVVHDVLVVCRQHAPQELVFGVVDRLDNEPVVPREVEETATLPGRAELRQDVLGGERKEVVRGVNVEVFLAEFAKDPRRVVFELEVVPCAWGELIPDDVEIVLVCGGVVLVCERTFKFGLTPGDLEAGPLKP
jgi:hypothetical protein